MRGRRRVVEHWPLDQMSVFLQEKGGTHPLWERSVRLERITHDGAV
jgi:hypothetical protein